ncbi:MAG: CapA family protein, partial [Lachnospiraceae bacterium]|nr:CapA family protein [Lachnospiraceae bacterium]
TLITVVAIGLFAMFSFLWIIEPAKAKDTSHFQLTSKRIEQDAAGQEAAEESEQSRIDEILHTNNKYTDILNDPLYMEQNNIYAKDAADPTQVSIAFAGDILFDTNYAIMSKVLQNGGDIAGGIAPDLINEMKSVDIMALNNEFPYSDRGTPTPEKQFTFRAKPAAVSYLGDMGVDLVSLANNHAYDYGEPALLDTLDVLREAGITYMGAGRNLEEARRPVYYIINNMKIAFVAATQIERLDNPDTKGATDTSAGVFRCWNGENLLATVREAKENSDFVIVFLHWGTENTEAIDWAQEKQAPEVVEAGADLIIGAHPHCLQQIDMINGIPVVYSLGNFWFNSKTVDTGIIKIILDENGLKSLQFVPCLQSGCMTSLVQGEEKSRILNYMRELSTGVQIDADGYIIRR